MNAQTGLNGGRAIGGSCGDQHSCCSSMAKTSCAVGETAPKDWNKEMEGFEPKPFYDFIVIGAGPAGTTFAQLMADAGNSVLILEAARYPRFAVGEIIAPTGIWRVWSKLGITRQELDSQFIRKWNGGWQAPSGEVFNFEQDVFPDDPVCEAFVYSFDRSIYDHFLLNKAREHGVIGLEEAMVDDVLYDGSGRMNGVRFTRHGKSHEVRCKLVVDASGRVNFLARKLDLRMEIDKLRSISTFAHWEGVKRNAGRAEGDVRIVYQKDMWFWFAPLKGDKVSIGIVADREIFADEYYQDPSAFYDKYVWTCPFIADRIKDGARRLTKFQPAIANKGTGGSNLHGYHFYTKQLAGNGWVIVGDAAGFIDPIFSAGLYIVHESAANLADKLIADMKANNGEIKMEPLIEYQEMYFKQFREILSHIQQFATYYFDPKFTNFFVKLGNSRPRFRQLYINTFVAYDPEAIREYSKFLQTRFRFRGDEFGREEIIDDVEANATMAKG